MKPDLRPYMRTLDLAPRPRLELPAHVDGQLHLRPATFFLLGTIAGAMAAFLCLGAITLL